MYYYHMQKETMGIEDGLEIADSGLSLETPEAADARVAAMVGQIAENNRTAEVAQEADAATVQPQIEELRRTLGVPIEKPTEVEMISDAVETSALNLERRMRGEISGSELDKLDAENEQQIDNARAEMRRRIEEAQSGRNNAGDSAQAKEFPVDGAPQEVASSSAVPNFEKADATESDGSRFSKLNEGEMFADRINAAPDLRSLSRFLGELGDITAPDGYVYKKEDTLRTIGFLKDSKDPNLQAITNTHGLRDKVRKLLLQREIE